LILFHKNTSNRSSDEELISEYLSGKDPEILGTLYQRYMYLVYGVCLKYLKNRDESKDVVIQLFEKLAFEIERHEVHNFKSWLYVMAKNYCFRKLQNDGAAVKKLQKYSEEQFMESTVEMSPLDDNTSEDMHKALNECLEKLKKEQKQCIQLFYYKELCYQEISDSLNLPLGKVKSYIQNGKRNLKICLEKQNG
jgi:RNA polymerase sigma-70 factor, ECF subfamily